MATRYRVFLSKANNLQKIVWFHVFKSNTNDFQTSIWPIDGTVTVIPTPGQNGTGNNGKEGLVWFYGISTIVGYLIPNSFLSI